MGADDTPTFGRGTRDRRTTFTPEPVGWVTELFGPCIRSPASDTPLIAWDGREVVCLHEEGGPNAVFEYSGQVRCDACGIWGEGKQAVR